jgi:DNA polymerase-3 subunit delta'
MFDHILGNDQVKAYLSKALRNHTLPHAIILSGPSGVGKSLYAKTLAAALLQTTKHKIEAEIHPDFHSLRPESKSGLHSIDSLRTLIDEVHSAPFESSGKVFLIYEAERMQTASANALLKTLEEPNPDTTLILLTEHPNEMIPTIRSRCVFLKVTSIPEKDIAHFLKVNGYEEKWAKMAQGSIGKALELSSKPCLEKPLFSLLAERPIYPKLLIALEKMEVAIEDEDPVKKNQNAEHLFTAFLMWHRDQYARRLGLSTEHLFTNEAEVVSFPLPKMEIILKRVEEARLSYQRNIKFSTCLERLFSIYTNPRK